MTDCCCPPAAETSVSACPRCGTKGVAVELQTVKALLAASALGRLEVTHHRFCSNPGCEVVYADDAGRTFTQEELRVPVWQKQPVGARMICYCFAETEASIRAEIEQSGQSGAIQRVRDHIAARRCACDIRNPKGSCCLGDLIAAVKRVEDAVLPGRMA